MELERKIKLFFVSYGRLLFNIVLTIVIIIFVIQSLNSNVKKNNEKQKNAAEANIIKEEKKVEENKPKKIATMFIEYCLDNKTEEAYDMISETCKKEKYNSIEKFKEQYINKYFKITIGEYKIDDDKNPIEIQLIQDMLITGKTDSILKTNLIILDEEKIYIYD